MPLEVRKIDQYNKSTTEIAAQTLCRQNVGIQIVLAAGAADDGKPE
jgi:hypothetical protein